MNRSYSPGEELVHSVTHGFGALLSVAALIALIMRALSHVPSDRIASSVTGFALYGSSLIVLYASSAFYHAATKPDVKRILAIFDHSAIFILIAGSYTGWCLSILYGPLGWTLFGVVWFLAAVGIVIYVIWNDRAGKVTLSLYLIMGWLIVFAVRPISEKLSFFSLSLLAAGGIAYTVGCVFYVRRRIPWMHSIWHLFVLAGSVLQFFALYFSV